MTSHELCKFIINKYCKPPINWPREVKLAKKLISHAPEEKFWEEFDLSFGVNSLAFFLTGTGKQDFGLAVGRFKLANTTIEPYNVDNVKYGPDKEIKTNKKPKNIKEFFNY